MKVTIWQAVPGGPWFVSDGPTTEHVTVSHALEAAGKLLGAESYIAETYNVEDRLGVKGRGLKLPEAQATAKRAAASPGCAPVRMTRVVFAGIYDRQVVETFEAAADE